MPTYTLQDTAGVAYRLTTTDEYLARQWFSEWLPRLYPRDLPEKYGLPVIAVWPLPAEDSENMDWPADTRWISEPFTIPRDPKLALAAIAERRKWIEDQMRQANDSTRD